MTHLMLGEMTRVLVGETNRDWNDKDVKTEGEWESGRNALLTV